MDNLETIDPQNPDAVKKVQIWLRSRGYYNGPIDGKWGSGTTTAIAAMRQEEATQQNAALEQQRLVTQKAEAENDPAGQAMRFGTEFGPYAVGAGGGYLASRALKKQFANADIGQKDAVRRLAANTKLNPTAAANELERLNSARGMRTGLQFLAPAALLGGAAITRDVIAPQFSEDSSARKYINLAATGENAAGTVLGGKQLIDTVGRWASPNDPEDVAKIRSRAMPEESAPSSVPASTMTHGERAVAAARAAGATGIKTKAEAIQWLETPGNVTAENRAAVAEMLGPESSRNLPKVLNKLRGAGRYLLPLAAGGLAYDAASSSAQAAGASPSEARGSGLLAGGVAGGATAGVGYGLSKLPSAAGPMLNVGAAPSVVDAMTDYSPEDIQAGRAWMSRNLPDWMLNDRIREAGRREAMAQGGMSLDDAIGRVLAAIEEHNASVEPPAGRNPAIAYEGNQ